MEQFNLDKWLQDTSRKVIDDDGFLVEILNSVISRGAEVASHQQLKNTVAHMGKTQIGNCVYLGLGKIQFKIVFHSFLPRFTRSWAQRPVKMPVIMLQTSSAGR